MSSANSASVRSVPPLDIDLSIEHGSILNPAFRDMRDRIALRKSQAVRKIPPKDVADVHLRLPLDARLESSNHDGHENGVISVVAQRDIHLQKTTMVPTAFAAEHYEILKAKLWSRYTENERKVMLFLGATPGTGTSTTAASFAATLARDPQSKVLFINGNLRPSKKDQSKSLANGNDDPNVALAGLLTAESTVMSSTLGTGNMCILPNKTKCALPLSLFQSEAFDQFLRTVRERFDHVVIDAPPLQGFPESIVLSRKADGVVLVVEAGRTKRRAGLWAKQQIVDAGGKILGVVLNKRKFYIPNWLYRYI
jgi:protein-tyrosine kinase